MNYIRCFARCDTEGCEAECDVELRSGLITLAIGPLTPPDWESELGPDCTNHYCPDCAAKRGAMRTNTCPTDDT